VEFFGRDAVAVDLCSIAAAFEEDEEREDGGQNGEDQKSEDHDESPYREDGDGYAAILIHERGPRILSGLAGSVGGDGRRLQSKWYG